MTLSGVVFLLVSFYLAAMLPYGFGIPGFLGSHAATFPLYMISMTFSSVPYEGGLEVIGIMMFLFLLNCFLLPVSLTSLKLGKNTW